MASVCSHMAATDTKKEQLILPYGSPSVVSVTFLIQGPASTCILTTTNQSRFKSPAAFLWTSN